MPWGDRMGPAGEGPITGRGAGLCRGGEYAGYLNRRAGTGFGRWRARSFGFGRGRGGGRGYRHRYYETGLPGWMREGWPDENDEVTSGASTHHSRDREIDTAYLEHQAHRLESALQDIKKRLDSLRNSSDDKRDD